MNDTSVLAIMPFAPDDGMLVWFYERMREVGIRQTDVSVIYILDEPPANIGKRASVDQLRRSIERVKQAIDNHNPKVVVPLGSEALHMATGLRFNIEDARGYVIRPKERGSFPIQEWKEIGKYKVGNKKIGRLAGDPRYGWVKRTVPGLLPQSFTGIVIPAYTLDFIQGSGFSVGPAFKADMKRVKRAIDGQLNVVDDGFTFYNSLSSKREYRGNTQDDPSASDPYTGQYLALDIETAGAENQVIERVALSDGNKTHTLLWNAETLEYVNEQVQKSTGWIIIHNLPFDYPRLRDAGVDFTTALRERRMLDSMYMAAVVQPNLPKGLGRVVPFYLDSLMWKHMNDGDPELYNALDAYKTALIVRDGIEPMAKKMQMWSMITGHDFKWGPGIMPTIKTLSDMTEGGIRVNREYAMEWDRKLSADLRVYLDEWHSLLPEWEAGSPKQIASLLYDKWKLPVIRTPEKKQVTTNEYALVKLQAYIQTEYVRTRDNGPWRSDPRCTPSLFSLLLKIRETEKNLSTYCTPIILGDQQYVHPSYLPLSRFKKKDDDGESKGSTDTGRLAASNPNIQNQTLDSRRLYIPSHSDLSFVQHDYSRAELYAMAAMADDDVMLSDLDSDPYQRVADDVGTDRKTAKSVVLAGQYLAGAQKVSDMILKQQHFYVPPEECRRILDGIAQRWYKRTAYVKWLVETTCGNKFKRTIGKGYIINPFGRVRVFHDRRAAAAVDFIPQSIVADILWCVLRDVANVCEQYGGRLVTTVHDSILSEFPEQVASRAALDIKNVMERRFDCVRAGFYIPVSVEVGKPGKSWGEIKE